MSGHYRKLTVTVSQVTDIYQVDDSSSEIFFGVGIRLEPHYQAIGYCIRDQEIEG